MNDPILYLIPDIQFEHEILSELTLMIEKSKRKRSKHAAELMDISNYQMSKWQNTIILIQELNEAKRTMLDMQVPVGLMPQSQPSESYQNMSQFSKGYFNLSIISSIYHICQVS